MDLPLKIHLALFIMEVMMILGIANMSSQMQITNAQNFTENAVAEIGNSNFNPKVINSLISEASSDNLKYDMTVVLYDSNKNSYTYTTPVATVNDTKDAITAEITVKYKTTNNFLGYTKEKETHGSVR